jgi:hypothetical protein
MHHGYKLVKRGSTMKSTDSNVFSDSKPLRIFKRSWMRRRESFGSSRMKKIFALLFRIRSSSIPSNGSARRRSQRRSMRIMCRLKLIT